MLRDFFPGIALEGKIYSIIWAEIFFKNWAQYHSLKILENKAQPIICDLRDHICQMQKASYGIADLVRAYHRRLIGF